MGGFLVSEWRILRRECAPGLLIASYSLLLAYGCFQSALRVKARETQVEAASRDYETRWAGLREAASRPAEVWGDWRSPSLVGGPTGFAVTWIPVDGLAALSVGESLRVPSVRRISIYPAEEEPPLENPLAPAGGLFDLSFVVVWLMPLTIVATIHAVVSGDRDRGIWALVVANSRNPRAVAGARVMLPGLVVSSITVLAGGLAVFASSSLPADGAARLSMWAVLVVAYASFWAMAAGIASTRCATAPSALVSLGLVWVTLVWIVPGLVDAFVTARIPPPNSLDPRIAAREVQRDLETKLPAMVEDIYSRRPDWRPSAEVIAAATKPVPGGPASRDSRRVFAPSLAGAAAAEPFVVAEAARRSEVEGLVTRLSVFSPALATQLIGDHLAGTSSDRFLAFQRYAKAAERDWSAFFGPRIMQLRDMTRSDMDAVPTPKAFVDPVDSSRVVWPCLGLCIGLSIVATLFALSLRGVIR